MRYQFTPKPLQPSEIRATETYEYESEVSSAKYTRAKHSLGSITTTFPYDRHKHWSSQSNVRGANSVGHKLLGTNFGSLYITEYGRSNLNNQPERNWDRDELPIRLELEDYSQPETNLSQWNRFDLELSHLYQPDQPTTPPLEVSVHILDEDYIRHHGEDTLEKTLVEQLSKQMSLKRNLIVRFYIKLILPEQLGQLIKENPPVISSMALSWTIGTPYRLASVYADRFLRRPEVVLYNPEQSEIEWNGIPLQFESVEDKTGLYRFKAERIQLEISEPAEIYEADKLSGWVTIELDNLLSGMQFEFTSPFSETPESTTLVRKSFITNRFRLNLGEGLERKNFLPRQHLHFPGIIFDHMRLADIVMLLEDKGFVLPKKWLSELVLDETDKNGNKIRRYSIEAKRAEGARKLKISIQVQGTDSRTTREREILGKQKYTTPLPIGYTDIFIQGEMQGDPKYIIREVNELQKQLKEQFGFVSTVG